MIVAVLPFLAADQIDPDADALARWLTAGTAAKLADAVEVQQVVDPVGFSAEAIGGAAAALGAQAALGARIKLGGGAVEVSALLANASGVARAEWSESVPLGSAPQLALLLARGVLLGLSEDSLAPPETAEAEMPAEAVLRLARAASLPDPNELLALVEELPAFRAPRVALLRAAVEAMGGERMPEHLAALERLVEMRPDDAEALLALGDYRAVHFDEVGARKLFLAARTRCTGGSERCSCQRSRRKACRCSRARRCSRPAIRSSTCAWPAPCASTAAIPGARSLPPPPPPISAKANPTSKKRSAPKWRRSSPNDHGAGVAST